MKSGLLGCSRTCKGPSIVDVTCQYHGQNHHRKWHTEQIPWHLARAPPRPNRAERICIVPREHILLLWGIEYIALLLFLERDDRRECRHRPEVADRFGCGQWAWAWGRAIRRWVCLGSRRAATDGQGIGMSGKGTRRECDELGRGGTIYRFGNRISPSEHLAFSLPLRMRLLVPPFFYFSLLCPLYFVIFPLVLATTSAQGLSLFSLKANASCFYLSSTFLDNQ